jgi:hypothetical protein
MEQIHPSGNVHVKRKIYIYRIVSSDGPSNFYRRIRVKRIVMPAQKVDGKGREEKIYRNYCNEVESN